MTDKPDRQTQAVAEAGESLVEADEELLAGWNKYYSISQQGNMPAHNEAKYAVRNQWRHILAMANVLYEENKRLKTAIATSDAQYVPMLVEALEIARKHLSYTCGNINHVGYREKDGVRFPYHVLKVWHAGVYAAHQQVENILSQLPEDLR